MAISCGGVNADDIVFFVFDPRDPRREGVRCVKDLLDLLPRVRQKKIPRVSAHVCGSSLA